MTERFSFTKAEDFFGRAIPKLDWTVRNLVEQGTFVVLGGEPKTSKTWATLEIALSVATGRPAFNEPAFECEAPRPVFLFLLEDGEYNVQARMEALASSKGVTEKQLKRMPLHVRCRRPICLDEDADHIIDHINDFMKEHELLQMRKGLIMIDPLRNAHHREENDSGEMRQVMDACLRIRDRTGYSLLINHHFKKIPKNQEESPGNAMRGSSSIYGSVDGIIGMRRIDSDEKNTWKNKNKSHTSQ